MGEEYTYDIGKYTIGVDTNGEGGIGLTVAIIENDKINFLGNCYGDNARCIDLLIRENQELKNQLEEHIRAEMKAKDELEQQRKEYQETYKDVRVEIKGYKTQQKEFIEYLESEMILFQEHMKEIECSDRCHGDYPITYYTSKCRLNEVTEILSKYKEIIGDKE